MSEVTFIIARVLRQNPLEIEAHKDRDLYKYYAASSPIRTSVSHLELIYAIAEELENYFGVEFNENSYFYGVRTARDFERLVRNALK
jgi:hypothetical protein